MYEGTISDIAARLYYTYTENTPIEMLGFSGLTGKLLFADAPMKSFCVTRFICAEGEKIHHLTNKPREQSNQTV